MDNTRIIEVEGMTITVDTVKTGSWGAFQLLKKARQETDELDQYQALVELIEYATDTTEAEVVEHLGGDNAQFLEVVRVMATIAGEIYPKN